MAVIGYNTQGGFNENPTDNGTVLTSKYAAPQNMTPISISVYMTEQWGQSGTVYCAIYTDNAGVPGTKLFDGSATYAALFNGWKTVTVTGSQLTSGTNYWLCAYWYKDAGGTFLITAYSDTSTETIRFWTESVQGSWTNSPTTSPWTSSRKLSIYATDSATTTSTTSSSTSSTSSSSSTSLTTSSSSSSTSSTSSSSSTSSTSSSTSSTSSSTSSTSSSTSSTSSSSSTSITISTSSTSSSTSSTSSSTSSTSSSSSTSSTSTSNTGTTSSSSSSTSSTSSSSSSTSHSTSSTSSSSSSSVSTSTSHTTSSSSSSSSSSSTSSTSSSSSSSSSSSTIFLYIKPRIRTMDQEIKIDFTK